MFISSQYLATSWFSQWRTFKILNTLEIIHIKIRRKVPRQKPLVLQNLLIQFPLLESQSIVQNFQVIVDDFNRIHAHQGSSWAFLLQTVPNC